MFEYFSCVLLLTFSFFNKSWCHKEIAGSCDSPQSTHHNNGRDGDGGYSLTVLPKSNSYTASQDITFVLSESEDHGAFRGFQLICEGCEFPNIESNNDAQINHRHCRLPGRISHTNNSAKSEVKIQAKIPEAFTQDITVEYYIVKSDYEWYGPMFYTISAGNGVGSGRLSTEDRSVEETCQPSSIDPYSCMAEAADYFKIHWMETNASSSQVDMLIEVKTPGWASLAFARIKGKMHPADAVLGWIAPDGTHHIEAYHIIADIVLESNANSSLLEVKSIRRDDEWLYLEFSKSVDGGLIPINLTKDTYLNYAIGKEPRLVEHNKYGSIVLSFLTGEVRTASFRKYYQVHGALMVIAWMILLPLSILVARSKWSLQGMGLNGWLEIHKWLTLFIAICLVCGLAVAVFTFQSIESSKGKMHRLMGILTTIHFIIQIVLGILRPAVDSPSRPLFNVGHAWSGRSLAVIAWMTVLLGISAFHQTTTSSSVPWITSVVLLLVMVLSLALIVEWKLKFRIFREGELSEVNMVQVPYTRPELEDESEEIDSALHNQTNTSNNDVNE